MTAEPIASHDPGGPDLPVRPGAQGVRGHRHHDDLELYEPFDIGLDITPDALRRL
ncbi:hypothetical protein ABZ079_02670 [Streptomyces sp. NPDC006314]|uniref:hypothetical protein n=1 Tax=Streptomyces sp. NPDC006314 TaxID=3154475 RepID=UPI0033A1D780